MFIPSFSIFISFIFPLLYRPIIPGPGCVTAIGYCVDGCGRTGPIFNYYYSVNCYASMFAAVCIAYSLLSAPNSFGTVTRGVYSVCDWLCVWRFLWVWVSDYWPLCPIISLFTPVLTAAYSPGLSPCPLPSSPSLPPSLLHHFVFLPSYSSVVINIYQLGLASDPAVWVVGVWMCVRGSLTAVCSLWNAFGISHLCARAHTYKPWIRMFISRACMGFVLSGFRIAHVR